jgi:transcriptional regulator with XRE-family HTH domain
MLGNWVKVERQRRAWSQQELARRAGIAQAHISKIELGQRTNPGSDVLLGLAQAFEMSVDDIMKAAGIITPSSIETPEPIGGELAELWPSLDTEDQAVVIQVVRRLAKGTRS